MKARARSRRRSMMSACDVPPRRAGTSRSDLPLRLNRRRNRTSRFPGGTGLMPVRHRPQAQDERARSASQAAQLCGRPQRNSHVALQHKPAKLRATAAAGAYCLKSARFWSRTARRSPSGSFAPQTSSGIKTVGVFSEEDKLALHRFKADEAYQIGRGPHLEQPLGPIEAYLSIAEILRVARALRRRRHPSGLRPPLREPGIRRRLRRGRASPSSAPRPTRCASSATRSRRATLPSPPACRSCRRPIRSPTIRRAGSGSPRRSAIR